jgi:hypothetical protein
MALGIMVGVMIAAFYLTRKGRKKESEYDEMQLKIRAKGYQIGFYTALFLIMLLVFAFEMNLITFVTPGFAVFAILIISVTVFVIYCILHNAFLSISGNAKSYLGIISMVVLIEGIVTVRYAINGELLENGQLGFGGGAPALMFVCFLAILITLIVKTIRNGKEAEE